MEARNKKSIEELQRELEETRNEIENLYIKITIIKLKIKEREGERDVREEPQKNDKGSGQDDKGIEGGDKRPGGMEL